MEYGGHKQKTKTQHKCSEPDRTEANCTQFRLLARYLLPLRTGFRSNSKEHKNKFEMGKGTFD